VERSSERFVRLTPNAHIDGVQAVLPDGVLTVTVPKDNDHKGARPTAGSSLTQMNHFHSMHTHV
jgi:HSP20 family molecular chaperone IbpA